MLVKQFDSWVGGFVSGIWKQKSLIVVSVNSHRVISDLTVDLNTIMSSVPCSISPSCYIFFPIDIPPLELLWKFSMHY
jgi:hypothetical protein